MKSECILSTVGFLFFFGVNTFAQPSNVNDSDQPDIGETGPIVRRIMSQLRTNPAVTMQYDQVSGLATLTFNKNYSHVRIIVTENGLPIENLSIDFVNVNYQEHFILDPKSEYHIMVLSEGQIISDIEL